MSQSIQDVIGEFGKLKPPTQDAPGYTTPELAREWGCSVMTVRARLKLALEAGILRTGRKSMPTLAGHSQRVPCFWIERPAAASSKASSPKRRRTARA